MAEHLPCKLNNADADVLQLNLTPEWGPRGFGPLGERATRFLAAGLIDVAMTEEAPQHYIVRRTPMGDAALRLTRRTVGARPRRAATVPNGFVLFAGTSA